MSRRILPQLGDESMTSAIFYRGMLKAKKGHTCCCCGKTINAGDVYEHIFGEFDGKVGDRKSCSSCRTIRYFYHIMNPESPDYGYPNLLDDARELAKSGDSKWHQDMLALVNLRVAVGYEQVAS